MVVDDSRTQKAIISEYLAELHCDITLCNSGTNALIQVSERVPDLIILNVEMLGFLGSLPARP
jgi:CheY-like chemotaxis protein